MMSLNRQMWSSHGIRLLFALLFCGLAATSAHAQVGEGDALSFTLSDLEGNDVNTEDLSGKVVLVDFWATWCTPCRAAFTFYSGLLDSYGAQGFVVVAVSVDENRADLERYVDREELPFTVVWDEEHDLVSRVEPPSMPTSYLLGPDGTVRAVFAGFETDEGPDIEAAVAALMAELPSPEALIPTQDVPTEDPPAQE